MYADENFYHNRTHKNTRESVLLNYESVLLNYETLLDLFSNYLHYLMSKSNKIFLSLFARLFKVNIICPNQIMHTIRLFLKK